MWYAESRLRLLEQASQIRNGNRFLPPMLIPRNRATQVGTGLPQLRNQCLNLVLLVLVGIELERLFELLHRLGSIALLRVSHPQVEAIGRLVRIFGDQLLEDIDGVVRQALLQVDPAESVGDLR